LKKFYNKSVILSFTFALFVTCLFSGTKVIAAGPELDIKAEAALLVEAETGKILYSKNPDKLLPPASMTKMMTEYLILEAIDQGKIDLNSTVEVSQFHSDLSHNRGLSNVDLRSDADPKYTVEELLEAAAIYSANAATMALAEKIAGSESNFVQMMSEKAAELGMENYTFVNSTGLNNRDLNGNHPSGGPEDINIMSARDTAILAYHLIKDYPEVLKYSSIPKKKFREGTEDAIPMANWNWMLPGLVKEYEGVDGLKTGSTDEEGASFTGTAERNGMRLISVVMVVDRNDNIPDREQRFEETAKLLNYGFSNFEKVELLPAGYQPEKDNILKVVKGKEKEVEVETNKPISAIILKGEKENYKPKVVFDEKVLDKKDMLTAPINKGDKVGVVQLTYSGESDYGYLTTSVAKSSEVALVTVDDVEKANWFTLMMRGIGGFFGDIWSSVTNGIKGLF
jgi:D-alanyl-D-alanine carboxypeptidase (penicillin-binding protein 5/6)